MSYPSITSILKERNIDLNTATEGQLESSLIEAFQRDLPLGYGRVAALVAKLKENVANNEGTRAMVDANSKTDEAKQFIRLLGADVARKTLENHFGVKLAFYNCHKGIAALDMEGLKITAREQILAQDEKFIDC